VAEAGGEQIGVFEIGDPRNSQQAFFRAAAPD
jgi:hypothetical protein